jgi:hypothetical protein
MKHQPPTPCREWADRLIASHTDALSLSEYLVLKEHLLACPACAEAHNRYLSVEAQIRGLPVLQPQRRLSAELLIEQVQKDYARPHTTSVLQSIIVVQKYAAMMRSTGYRVLCQFSAWIRKPVYALVILLFCLLMAGMGAASFTLSSTTIQQARAPHLAVSTTLLDLNPVKDVPFSTQNIHRDTEQLVFAINVLTLHNTGERTLNWRLDTTRSIAIFAPSKVRLWTVPSHGTLDSNGQSLIQVVAGGIARTELATKQNIELGYIVFTSNGGDASIRTTLKSTPIPEPQGHPTPPADLLKIALPYSTASPAYVLRRQNL